MSENASPRPSAGRTALLILALLVIVANLAILSFQAARFDAMGARVQELEREVFLYRMERTSQTDGFGFNALLEQLLHHAPALQSADRSGADYERLAQRIGKIVQAIGRLPDAYDQVKRVLDDPRRHDADSDEIRKWLVRAAQVADPTASQDLLAALAIDETDIYSGRIRKFAAEELALSDAKRAGDILHTILTTENFSGSAVVAGVHRTRRPQKHYYNFIDIYVGTGHSEIERTLMRILGHRKSHDSISIQRTVIALGKMKSRDGAKRIQKLYWSPAPGEVPNPLFRKYCLIAVMETLGAEAADFFNDVDLKERDGSIRKKLEDYRSLFN